MYKNKKKKTLHLHAPHELITQNLPPEKCEHKKKKPYPLEACNVLLKIAQLKSGPLNKGPIKSHNFTNKKY